MKTYYCDDEHGNPVYIYREDPTRKFPLWEEPKLALDATEVFLIVGVFSSLAVLALTFI